MISTLLTFFSSSRSCSRRLEALLRTCILSSAGWVCPAVAGAGAGTADEDAGPVVEQPNSRTEPARAPDAKRMHLRTSRSERDLIASESLQTPMDAVGRRESNGGASSYRRSRCL